MNSIHNNTGVGNIMVYNLDENLQKHNKKIKYIYGKELYILRIFHFEVKIENHYKYLEQDLTVIEREKKIIN
ncbi:MAG: hypothetical protein KFW21_01460 [Spirochaetota bacterium]|nr:hypothetical protein [Spirochaetota bacterium]